MNLYEFEGLDFFDKAGIKTPQRVLLKTRVDEQKVNFPGPYMVKAQVLAGKRGKSGLVLPWEKGQDLGPFLETGTAGVLIEKKLEPQKQYYLSITYDTRSRSPVILFSDEGGVGIEEAKDVKKFPVDLTKEFEFKHLGLGLNKVVSKLWEVFVNNDCRLAEINPLFETKEGLVAVDSKIILDEDGMFRHEDFHFEPRDLVGKEPSWAETEAKKIDANDHRGSAGSSYFDLGGDIAVIAAGGGGSVVNMDALIACGGKPANYTEHSGNPPREKVKRLTEIVLAKKGLNGLWLVGATANFTDMFETLSGFVEGLRTIQPKPSYPIVLRRGGPRWEEAKKMLEEVRDKEGFDLHIYGPETPMTSTAKIIVELSDKYKQ
ncbi:MAG TPA: ATP citrate lyase citrate-binding domain-containing protein [Candidatus Nanoarchaeia archaeon]|nr:succinate--CoA ligase [ADP-forming] subunit beta [uncultured archaeon]